jgi:hypothetical protein
MPTIRNCPVNKFVSFYEFAARLVRIQDAKTL